ncbi:hypothetical protein Scep_029758 [Stephania cephalantha]|uniref:Uncharacterized protein n=1 Tax=Stephania cephalantha TaxID=152367 RepID=A0AAP0E1X5_9MAGN
MMSPLGVDTQQHTLVKKYIHLFNFPASVITPTYPLISHTHTHTHAHTVHTHENREAERESEEEEEERRRRRRNDAPGRRVKRSQLRAVY